MPDKDIDQAKLDYVTQGGKNCFKCGSGEIEGGSFSVEAGKARQSVWCNQCDNEWDDVYTLTGVGS